LKYAYLERLNDRQRQAALQTDGAVLILAGAGSGKTSTLTARIAYLIDEGLAAPWEILAITFTNKAAGEMRSRVAAAVGEERASRMWIYTFHACCVQLLRRHIDRLPGYTRSFSIYDDDDTQSVIKQILSRMNLSEKVYAPRMVSSVISNWKNKLLSPQEAAGDATIMGDRRMEPLVDIYKAYEAALKAANALDFDDLLIRCLELFVECPDILAQYQQRFRYIHVDEYQDTNMVQYEWVKALSGGWGNLCVVGDDDQSIYGWRGADIRNILDFEKDFRNATVIRLEQNYRSTQRILDAANAVISHNLGRKQKSLWSDLGEGELIRYAACDSDRAEAQTICGKIRAWVQEGGRYSDCAILYRTNSLSRVLEEGLMGYGIPYQMVGGTRFYDRREIKDLTAYLRLILNPKDDICLRRIINVPKRGIGAVSVTRMGEYAAAAGISIGEWLADRQEVARVLPRAAAALDGFQSLLEELRDLQETLDLTRFVQTVLDKSGLQEQYLKEADDEAQGRLENLGEYLSAVQQYASAGEGATLEGFLEQVALVSDLDTTDMDHDSVTLMTVHAAKGLEFPVVFLAGMEENLFPHFRAVNEGEDQIEEERRLCYVAITRAMKQLHISSAAMRMTFGMTQHNGVSRFLREIPESLLDEPVRRPNRYAGSSWETDDEEYSPVVRRNTPVQTRPKPGKSTSDTISFAGSSMGQAAKKPASTAKPKDGFRVGDRVSHPSFGIGTVVQVSGDPGRHILSVAFEGKGIKKLSEAMAPLKRA